MGYSKIHKAFLLDILSKVKYMDYRFKYDTLSFPTSKQVKDLKSGTYTHKLRVDILHFGKDNDLTKDQDPMWLTYCGCVEITHWSESAIVEAIYKTLVQKFRHEVSEVFRFEDKILFHEHRVPKITIPQ